MWSCVPADRESCVAASGYGLQVWWSQKLIHPFQPSQSLHLRKFIPLRLLPKPVMPSARNCWRDTWRQVAASREQSTCAPVPSLQSSSPKLGGPWSRSHLEQECSLQGSSLTPQKVPSSIPRGPQGPFVPEAGVCLFSPRSKLRAADAPSTLLSLPACAQAAAPAVQHWPPPPSLEPSLHAGGLELYLAAFAGS